MGGGRGAWVAAGRGSWGSKGLRDGVELRLLKVQRGSRGKGGGIVPLRRLPALGLLHLGLVRLDGCPEVLTLSLRAGIRLLNCTDLGNENPLVGGFADWIGREGRAGLLLEGLLGSTGCRSFEGDGPLIRRDTGHLLPLQRELFTLQEVLLGPEIL